MSKIDDLESYLQSLTENELSLENWIKEREGTLIWKIRHKLDEENNSLSVDKKSVFQELESIKLPDPDDLVLERRKFTKGLNRIFWILLIIVLAFSFAYKNIPAMRTFGPFIGLSITRIVIWAIGFFISSYFAALFVYYRGWSKYLRSVNVAQAQIDISIAKLAYFKDESARLKSVHDQAKDWFRMLGRVLFEPWKVLEKWRKDLTDSLNVNQIPLAVRFAKAHSGTRGTAAALERGSLNLVVRKGWRKGALESLVAQSALELGEDTEVFTIRRLDSDIPEASNGARSAFSNQIESGSITAAVADEKVIEVAKRVREEIIPTILTPVKSLHKDSLESLDWTFGGSNDDNWLEFFAEIYGATSKKAPALSILPLTDIGMSRAVHENFESFALIPDRIKVEEPGLSVFPHDGDSPRWIDLAVRIDLSGPNNPDDFKVISKKSVRDSQSGQTDVISTNSIDTEDEDFN